MRLRMPVMVAIAALLIAVPAGLYLANAPGGGSPTGSNKGLDGVLRGMGFNPINPPSNLISLGSIYQVSADGREYRTICVADPALVEGSVRQSPGIRAIADELRRASYALEADVAKKVSERIGAENAERVRYSLTDVTLEEVPLATNRAVFIKLIENPDCRNEIDSLLRYNQFVCQGQALLTATAEYDVATASDLTNEAKAEQTVAAVKEAIEADTQVQLHRSGGKLVTGKALHYGVKVNPLCIAPAYARFARTLPQSRLDRIRNFIAFSIIEPVLPAPAD